MPEIRGAAPEKPSNALASVKFTLREIRIEGATVLPQKPWSTEASRYIGHQITGNDVFDLARRLTAAYRDAGYILSQVIVPPQSLAGGVLTLRVVEGYIAEVHVEGDPALHDTLTKIGEKIKASRPLRESDLERYLLLANDLPGIRLRSILSPSRTPGAADLTLIAHVRKVDGYVSLDNYGSKYLGPGELSASVAGYHMFGADSELRLTGVTTGNSELGYGQLSYGQVVNVEGLKLGASVSQARTRPGDTLAPYDVRANADAVTVSLGYPLLRTRNRSLFVRAVYDHRYVDIDVLGTRTIQDNIQAIRLGATWLALDALDGQNSLDVEFSRGVGGTDKSDPLKSRAGADSHFSKLTFDYQRFQSMGANYSLTLGLGGQWTNVPLLSSEQYALGGRRFGRAYEPAELVGDRALAFRAEPAYTRRTSGDWLKAYQLYGFYDVGKIWDKDNGTGSSTGQSLASAGFGTRLFLDKNVTAKLEAAWPLTKPVASYQADGEGKHVRFLGSLAARF